MDARPAHDSPARNRRPGDGWVECACGQRHWGLHGAAGLLLARRTASGTEVVLQHRATWSHHGSTWALPGGAVGPDETAVQGALREAHEEAGVRGSEVDVRDAHVLDHGTWSYTTVLAVLRDGAAGAVSETDDESLEIRWVALDDVASRPLLPAFAAAWPELRSRVEQLVAPA